MTNQAHIIVGCGGSGIRALIRLNELLSQDYYWRRRLDNDIYYVVVETDTGDMKLFDDKVRKHLSGTHDSLYITPVILSAPNNSSSLYRTKSKTYMLSTPATIMLRS